MNPPPLIITANHPKKGQHAKLTRGEGVKTVTTTTTTTQNQYLPRYGEWHRISAR